MVRILVTHTRSVDENIDESIEENKEELFAFLAARIATAKTEKQIISTNHKDVLCTQPEMFLFSPRLAMRRRIREYYSRVQDAVTQKRRTISVYLSAQ